MSSDTAVIDTNSERLRQHVNREFGTSNSTWSLLEHPMATPLEIYNILTRATDTVQFDDYLRALTIYRFEPLWQHEGKKYVRAYRDVVISHRRVYKWGSILHRNICPESVMILQANDEPNSEYHGILTDFDFSVSISKRNASYASSSQTNPRIGTPAFMARELLWRSRPQIVHSYKHDLESLHTLLLLSFLGYGREGTYASSKLERWKKAPWQSITREKDGILTAGSFYIELRLADEGMDKEKFEECFGILRETTRLFKLAILKSYDAPASVFRACCGSRRRCLVGCVTWKSYATTMTVDETTVDALDDEAAPILSTANVARCAFLSSW